MKSILHKQKARFIQAMVLPLSGVFLSLFAAAMPQSAFAWTWAQKVTVYNGPGLCVQGDAGIDHIKPNSFSGNLAYGTTYAFTEGCGTTLALPDGRAAVKLGVYKWNGSAWALCKETDWKFGATGIGGSGDIRYPSGPSLIFDYGGASSCGQGYYGTQVSSYVWDGLVWRGGSVWSGYEFVP